MSKCQNVNGRPLKIAPFGPKHSVMEKKRFSGHQENSKRQHNEKIEETMKAQKDIIISKHPIADISCRLESLRPDGFFFIPEKRKAFRSPKPRLRRWNGNVTTVSSARHDGGMGILPRQNHPFTTEISENRVGFFKILADFFRFDTVFSHKKPLRRHKNVMFGAENSPDGAVYSRCTSGAKTVLHTFSYHIRHFTVFLISFPSSGKSHKRSFIVPFT